ncbi:hypothetical protein Tco_0901088, partial [Tanacetum coccineum]
MGRSGIRIRGVLLQDQQHKIYIGKVHWIRAKEATGWIPEFSEDEEDDDHSEQEFISSEQSDLGLHIDGEDNSASEV